MKNLYLVVFLIALFSCNNSTNPTTKQNIKPGLEQYALMDLKTDLSVLEPWEKEMLPVLFEASYIMDRIFLYQVIGNTDTTCLKDQDEISRNLFEINFGPWDRLNSDIPFIKCLGEKPLGVNFYPLVMSSEEFDAFPDSCKKSPYTFIRRNNSGNLMCVPYNQVFPDLLERVSGLLNVAAQISQDTSFSEYLKLRASALLTDNYYKSDSAWLNLRNTRLDILIGPIDINEDRLYGYKSEYQSYVLVKDIEWSSRLAKYSDWLKYLQKSLPVPPEYRSEEPTGIADFYVYDVIHYGGSGKAGGAMVSFNAPLENYVRKNIGHRNLQFKNIIQYKFEKILKPVSDIGIASDQLNNVTSEAFFTNLLFSELSKSLGVSQTIINKSNVNEVIKENSVILDMVKANMGALFLVKKLKEVNEFSNDINDFYVTWLANALRRIRLSTTNTTSISTLVCLNYLIDNHAIGFKSGNKMYVIDENFENASNNLLSEVLILQGDGDYPGAVQFVKKYSVHNQKLNNLIEKINSEKIPFDLVFNQGMDVVEY